MGANNQKPWAYVHAVSDELPSWPKANKALLGVCAMCGSTERITEEHIIGDWYLSFAGGSKLNHAQPHRVDSLEGYRYKLPLCFPCNQRAGKILEDPVADYFVRGQDVSDEILAVWSLWVTTKMVYRDLLFGQVSAQDYESRAAPSMRAIRRYLMDGFSFPTEDVLLVRFATLPGDDYYSEYAEFGGFLFSTNGRATLFSLNGFAQSVASSIASKLEPFPLYFTQLVDVAISIGGYSSLCGIGIEADKEGRCLRLSIEPATPWSKSGLLDRGALGLHSLYKSRKIKSTVVDDMGRLRVFRGDHDSAFEALGRDNSHYRNGRASLTGTMLDQRFTYYCLKLWRNVQFDLVPSPFDPIGPELPVLRGDYSHAARIQGFPSAAEFFKFSTSSIVNLDGRWATSPVEIDFAAVEARKRRKRKKRPKRR